MNSLHKIPLSYATCSIGNKPEDTLPRRLEAISNAGFSAIELSFPDILAYGSHSLGHEIEPENFAEIITAAGEIRKLCEANSLGIMMLQPFANFEGWPKGSIERQDAFTRANGWIEIMNVVGTDLLQVCSTTIVSYILGRERGKLSCRADDETGRIDRFPSRENESLLRLRSERSTRTLRHVSKAKHETCVRELVLVHARTDLERCLGDRQSGRSTQYRALS